MIELIRVTYKDESIEDIKNVEMYDSGADSMSTSFSCECRWIDGKIKKFKYITIPRANIKKIEVFS